MIETRPCGCRTVTDGEGRVSMVGTCSRCLPAGAITWLIENGRQLDIFQEPPSESGVREFTKGDDSNGIPESDPSEILIEIRSIDPSF